MNNINILLKNISNLNKQIFKLYQKNKITDKELDQWNDYSTSPPKNASLKMSQVKKLFKLRQSGNYKNNDFILVIEPQNYNKVSKLTPKNMMFKKNTFIKTTDKYVISNFHSGKSLLAHSGDGGDYGDLWWLANDAMYRWLQRVIKKANSLINNLKNKH